MIKFNDKINMKYKSKRLTITSTTTPRGQTISTGMIDTWLAIPKSSDSSGSVLTQLKKIVDKGKV